jgi:ribonuclease P protein component
VKRKFRLTRSTDLKRVRRYGKSFAHPLVVLVVLPSEETRLRFGFIAGRSTGRAVQRNRAKRLMREAVRSAQDQIQPGWDMVWIARRPMVDATYWEISEAVLELLERAGLVNE